MALNIQQILATLGIDSAEISVYDGGRYAVIQRDPQPNETDIPLNTGVSFLFVDLEGDPNASISAPNFVVTIDGNQACEYFSGVLTTEPEYNGTITAFTTESPYIFWKFELEQAPGFSPLFTSEQEVTIEIQIAATLGFGDGPFGHFPFGHSSGPGAPIGSYSYSFTCEDIEPPSLVSAEATGERTVRLTFDDNMSMSGDSSALNPSSYTITTMNADPDPGVDLEVISVSEVEGSNATQFDLTFDWEQTPSCLYRVDVSTSVTDSSGNAIE